MVCSEITQLAYGTMITPSNKDGGKVEERKFPLTQRALK